MGNWNSGRRSATALRMLRGNSSKRPLNRAEPKPPMGEVVKPVGISSGASMVWDELAPLCLAMGTLTPVDVRAFTMLCELEVTLALSRRWKADPERLLDGLKIEKEFAPIVRQYYGLFGLDPMSRSRIHVPTAAEAPVSKWAGVLK